MENPHIVRFLKKQGYEVGVCLGSGSEGTVWKIKNRKNTVLKHTTSDREYEIFRYLSKLRKALDFFPKVKKVWRRTSLDENMPVLIVREDVADIDEEEHSRYSNDFDRLINADFDEAEFSSSQKDWFIRVRRWCNEHNWLLLDLHSENIGKRNDTLVIRDLGLCSRTYREEENES